MRFLEHNNFFPSTCITYIFSTIMPAYSNPIQLVLVFLALYSLWPRHQFENESVKYRWKIALTKNKRDNMHIPELLGCTHVKYRSRDIIRIETSAITIQGDFQTGTHCQAPNGFTTVENLCSYVSCTHNSFDRTAASSSCLVWGHPEARDMNIRATPAMGLIENLWYCRDRVSSCNIYAVQQDTQSVLMSKFIQHLR